MVEVVYGETAAKTTLVLLVNQRSILVVGLLVTLSQNDDADGDRECSDADERIR